MTRIALAAVLASVTGCAAIVDGAYYAAGPDGSPAIGGPERVTGISSAWVELAYDASSGLVCRDVVQPSLRVPAGNLDYVNPNGYRLAMQLGTIFEGSVVGLASFLHFRDCDGCSHRNYTIAMVPLAIDLAWGIYRSFTIRNTIYKKMELRWHDAPGTAAHYAESPCPAGTVVHATPPGGAPVALVIGAGGALRLDQLRDLHRLLAAHGELTFSRPDGARIELDTEARGRFVATVDAEIRAERAAAARPEPAATRPADRTSSPGRVAIEWRGSQPIVDVELDVSVDLLCRSDAGCAGGERCADRGDGVPLCMGPDAPHGYCAADTDCPADQSCRTTAGGVGRCTPDR